MEWLRLFKGVQTFNMEQLEYQLRTTGRGNEGCWSYSDLDFLGETNMILEESCMIERNLAHNWGGGSSGPTGPHDWIRTWGWYPEEVGPG